MRIMELFYRFPVNECMNCRDIYFYTSIRLKSNSLPVDYQYSHLSKIISPKIIYNKYLYHCKNVQVRRLSNDNVMLSIPQAFNQDYDILFKAFDGELIFEPDAVFLVHPKDMCLGKLKSLKNKIAKRLENS